MDGANSYGLPDCGDSETVGASAVDAWSGKDAVLHLTGSLPHACRYFGGCRYDKECVQGQDKHCAPLTLLYRSAIRELRQVSASLHGIAKMLQDGTHDLRLTMFPANIICC